MNALHLGQVLARLFDNQVGHQHAVRASRSHIAGKLVQAIAQNRIEIGEDDQAGCGPCSANFAGQLDNILEPRSTGDRTLHGALNHRPVGQRIAERHAQLDHIGPCVDRLQRIARVASRLGSPAVKYTTSPGL